jgi:hypothetical protein
LKWRIRARIAFLPGQLVASPPLRLPVKSRFDVNLDGFPNDLCLIGLVVGGAEVRQLAVEIIP